MNKIKYLLLSLLILLGTTSFAAWSQPTAVPPQGNTEPPINVGTIKQRKKGTIEAYKFCLVKTINGIETLDCLGGNTPGPNTTFPWVFDGTTNNIKNTNEADNVLINKTRIEELWPNSYEKLTVGGKVKAEGFCLGNSCIDTDTGGGGDTIYNWQEVIKKYVSGITGPIGPAGQAGSSADNPLDCKPGEVLTWTRYGTSPNFTYKWTCGTGGLTGKTGPAGSDGGRGTSGVPGYGVPTNCTDKQVPVWDGAKEVWKCGTANFEEKDTLDIVTDRGNNTDNAIGVGGLVSGPANSIFTGNVGIGTGSVAPLSKLEVKGGPIRATGGLIIELKTQAETNSQLSGMEEGRLWLITDLP